MRNCWFRLISHYCNCQYIFGLYLYFSAEFNQRRTCWRWTNNLLFFFYYHDRTKLFLITRTKHFVIYPFPGLCQYEKCQTGLLWPYNQTGQRSTERRESPSDVRLRMGETQSGSINGKQTAQLNLQMNMNIGLLLMYSTLDSTDVEAET